MLNEQVKWDNVTPPPHQKNEFVLKIVLENPYEGSINNTD